MRGIIFMGLLLISCVLVKSDVRQKRTFSFLKELITSLFFENTPEIFEPKYEYVFYQVPGYNEFLIKSRPIKSVATEEIVKEKRETNIQPFESFLGTKSAADTLQTFQNIHNLLSTELFRKHECNSLRKIMSPMIIDTAKSMAQEENNLSDVAPIEAIPNEVVNETKVISEEPRQIISELNLTYPISGEKPSKQLANQKEQSENGSTSLQLSNTQNSKQELEEHSRDTNPEQLENKALNHLFDLNNVNDGVRVNESNNRVASEIITDSSKPAETSIVVHAENGKT